MILNSDPNGPNAFQLPDGTTIIGATPPPANQKTGARKLNFLGWGVLLLGLYALNKTNMGHEVIYLAMVLILLFLFIDNYKRITPVLTKQA